MDKAGPILFLGYMAKSEEKLVTPLSLVIDLVLVVAFFVYIYGVVSTHVPSRNPHMIMLFGALCAACMTGVFWLAVQMFRVVLNAQLAANAAKKKH